MAPAPRGARGSGRCPRVALRGSRAGRAPHGRSRRPVAAVSTEGPFVRRPEAAFTILAGAALAVYSLLSAPVPEALPAGSAAAVTLFVAGAAFRPVPPERRLRYRLLPVGPREEARARAVSAAVPGLAASLPVAAVDAVLFGPVHGAALLGAVLAVLVLDAACGTLALAALEDREEPPHGSRSPGFRIGEQETGGGAGVALTAALWSVPYLLWRKLGAHPAALAAAMLLLAAAAAAAYAFVERGLGRGRPRGPILRVNL
jgi:hypothetical protein